MTIHHLKTLVSDDFAAMNTLIVNKVQAQIGLIDDLASHIFQSGGKRLRPLLVLLASHACGYQGQAHITLAAMIEFFHTATLLHDDVIDESTLRRGRETANEIWGSKASILVGDYLLTQYMQLMLEIGDRKIMELLTDIAHQITCGEIKQLSHRYNYNLTVDEYFDVIRSKTSLLFAASATLGAMINHQGEQEKKALYAFGLHLGNAFQLIDDALDYCSDAKTLGKNVGDDLADGKATLPLIHALKYGSPVRQQQIQKSLQAGSLDDLPHILDAIKETGAIDYTRQVAAQEIALANQSLENLIPSPYKDGLYSLAEYALQRDY